MTHIERKGRRIGLHEPLILETLGRLGHDGRAVSGHELRIALLGRGLDKREIAVAIGELVAEGILERLKVTDPDGLFYTAYRQVRGDSPR